MLTAILCLLLAANGWALFPPDSGVVNLTSKTFDEAVLKSDEVWMVVFYITSCGKCKKLAVEYEKAVETLKGVVHLAAVDADENEELEERYDVEKFPTVKIFGKDKTKPKTCAGKKRGRFLIEAALSAMEMYAVELTDGDFDSAVMEAADPWLVGFYSPSCPHCQKLVPECAKAAKELSGKVKVGAVDATKHTKQASKYNITGYPTIKFFPPGRKSKPEDYPGAQTSSSVVSWVLEKLEHFHPVDLIEITERASFDRACNKPLCIISILPHILDCPAGCRGDYLDVLRAVGENHSQWGWAWGEAGAQPDLEKAVDIGGAGYPAMVALSVKRMKYSPMRGSFSKDGIGQFLQELLEGRGSSAHVKGGQIPHIAKVELWDEKDPQMLMDNLKTEL